MRPMRFGPQARAGNGLAHLMGLVLFVIFLAAVIFVLVYMINRYATTKSNSAAAEDPLAVAKIRYAKGEITKDEFNQLKKDLD